MLKGNLEGWDVSADVAAISDRLRGLPGVLGVFWGEKHQGGAWLDRPSICVHVAKKRAGKDLPESERLPATLGGHSIDVLEIGEIRAHTVDVRGEVRASIVPGDHGGNLDSPLMRAGTTVYLPVSVRGALLAMGDGHARQESRHEPGEIRGLDRRQVPRHPVAHRQRLREPVRAAGLAHRRVEAAQVLRVDLVARLELHVQVALARLERESPAHDFSGFLSGRFQFSIVTWRPRSTVSLSAGARRR